MTNADLVADVWWFYYDTGNHLWLAVRGIGDYDAVAGTLVLGSTVFTTAAEYHYDSGRRRYLVRQRNPNPDDPTSPEGPFNPRWSVIGTGQWRDYLGNNIYNDYTVDMNTGTVTNGRAYMPGIGFDDPSLAETPAYLGTDLIGTTRRISGSASTAPPVLHSNVYTAFGELISSTGSQSTRYGYAGTWGYEQASSSDPLSELHWLHVGERYYDPAIGRFMQRDPIGISGGENTYTYVNNIPTIATDRLGLFFEWYDGAPLLANLTLFFTPKFLDNPRTTRNVAIGFAIVGACASGGALAVGFASASAATCGAASAVPLTVHGAQRVAERAISMDQINDAIANADAAITGIGRYGTPVVQFCKDGLSVIMETGGRNAGKIVTVFK